MKTLAENKTPPPSVRERLVLAAIDEVEQVGFERFSVRRVAENCGVSCAAPYKHFKNKRELFEAILLHINAIWLERQERTLQKFADRSIRRRLVEVSLEYVRFMNDNPNFRSILMIKDETFDDDYLQIKGQLSERSKELIRDYCREVGMPEKTAKIKMYVVRSLIYGASLMFGNGELPFDETHMKYVATIIDREFDLPWDFGPGARPNNAVRERYDDA